MNVDDVLSAVGFLLYALQDSLNAGQVVSSSGVEDNIALCHLFGDQFGIVDVAEDCFGTRLFEAVCVLLAANETGDLVAFCHEKVKDGPADEARSNDEDILASGHCGESWSDQGCEVLSGRS
jgi:hypothetical protein